MLGNGLSHSPTECLAWDALGFDLALSCSPAGKPWGATNLPGGKTKTTHGFKEGSEPLKSHSKSVSEHGLTEILTDTIVLPLPATVWGCDGQPLPAL